MTFNNMNIQNIIHNSIEWAEPARCQATLLLNKCSTHSECATHTRADKLANTQSRPQSKTHSRPQSRPKHKYSTLTGRHTKQTKGLHKTQTCAWSPPCKDKLLNSDWAIHKSNQTTPATCTRNNWFLVSPGSLTRATHKSNQQLKAIKQTACGCFANFLHTQANLARQASLYNETNTAVNEG